MPVDFPHCLGEFKFILLRECSFVLLLRINLYFKSVITMVGAFFGIFFGVIVTLEMSWDIVNEWGSCYLNTFNFTCNQAGVL